MNTLAQGALQRFTQRPWIDHPTFQLRGGHSTTELSPPRCSVFSLPWKKILILVLFYPTYSSEKVWTNKPFCWKWTRRYFIKNALIFPMGLYKSVHYTHFNMFKQLIYWVHTWKGSPFEAVATNLLWLVVGPCPFAGMFSLHEAENVAALRGFPWTGVVRCDFDSRGFKEF